MSRDDSPRRILLVEDEALIALQQQKDLEQEGYTVTVVGSGEEALTALGPGSSVDLVLMDIRLPGIGGIETAERILREVEIPIVFLTAFGDPETIARVSRVTRYGYVLKNSGRPLLLQTISMALELFETYRRSREKEGQLRQLARHNQEAREKQGLYIAREIHDELGQALTSLGILASLTREEIEASATELPEAIRYLDETESVLARTTETFRKLVRQLRPTILEDLGLMEALRWELEEFERRTGITANLRTSYTEPAEPLRECSLAAYRIAQEAITNVARHSEAETLWLAVEREAGEIRLEIVDDGKGFEYERLGSTLTFGLLGMEERAIACNGSLEIDSAPGHGTRIIARLPETAGQ